MKQYINKDAIAAKIKRRFDEYSSSILKHYDACKEARAQELGKILTILNTLETKEVDLGVEITLWANAIPEIRLDDVERLAKYFYELGLKSK